ncbi:MAG: YwiC-like family protein [Propionicimonas sp.]|nr:YwiC-like family protein [Propionicimonas sp.]
MRGGAERTRTAGWLPRQHGVWAMLVVPFAVGAMLCWSDERLPGHVATMFATWVLGYFAFHATSGLLKSPPQRRRRWVPAVATYGLATLAAGLLTAWEAGPAVFWWLLVFLAPCGTALWLASRRQERQLAGGLLTVLLASMMVLVVRFPDPTGMLADPAFPQAAMLAAVMFGYFAGTVFHIKAMIRRRGRLAWRNASIGWHAGWTVATAALTVTWQLPRAWPVFFLVTTLRSWALPLVDERRRLRPAVLGVVEVVLSVAALAIAAVTLGVVGPA